MIDTRPLRGGRLPLEIFRSLAESVIRQAVMDLHNDAFREDARTFFDGTGFDAYCEILGWNSRRARHSLQSRLDDLMRPDATPLTESRSRPAADGGGQRPAVLSA